MAVVLPFRQAKVKGLVKPKGPEQERLWFCTRCDSKSFNLELNGDVWCASCMSWVHNLRVKT